MTSTTKTPRADHVVLEQLSPVLARFLCRHCGESWSFEMPVDVDVLAAGSKPYANLHRYCEKRAEVTP